MVTQRAAALYNLQPKELPGQAVPVALVPVLCFHLATPAPSLLSAPLVGLQAALALSPFVFLGFPQMLS